MAHLQLVALELRREAVPRRRRAGAVRALQRGAGPCRVFAGPPEEDHAPGVVAGGQVLAAAVELDGRDFVRCRTRTTKLRSVQEQNTRY